MKGGVVTRRSTRNLNRLTSSAESDNPDRDVVRTNGTENISPNLDVCDSSELSQRGYALNMDKAIQKKIETCNTEYKVLSEQKANNYIFYFSTAMYELYRTALVEHFRSCTSNEQTDTKISYKDCSDQSGATVESQIKVYPKGNLKQKYIINMYHTKSKIMVNGSEAHRFSQEHSSITDKILQSEDVNKLDKDFRDHLIDGLKSIKLQQPSAVSEINVEQPQSPQNTNIHNDDTDDAVPCLSCDELVISDGIFCDSCECWLHYKCENLTSAEVERLTHSDDPYHCRTCNFERDCQILDSNFHDLEDLTVLTNDRNTEENDPSRLDITTHVKSISPMHSPKVSPHIQRPEPVNNLVKTPQPLHDSGNLPNYAPINPPVPVLGDGSKTQEISNINSRISTDQCRLPISSIQKHKQNNLQKPNVASTSSSDGLPGHVVHKKDSDTTGSVASQNGEKGSRKSVPKSNKQSKKVDKSNLKENEQEEQLKLAKSLINNLERKVNELENSNRILRREVLLGGNEVSDPPSNNAGHASMTQDTLNHFPHPPRSVIEQEVLNLRENIRNIEMEQLKTRIQHIEMCLMSQKLSPGMPFLGGHPHYPYNVHIGGYGLNPGGYWTIPGYHMPTQHQQAMPVLNPNMHPQFSHPCFRVVPHMPTQTVIGNTNVNPAYGPQGLIQGTNIVYNPVQATPIRMNNSHLMVPQVIPGYGNTYLNRHQTANNRPEGNIGISTDIGHQQHFSRSERTSLSNPRQATTSESPTLQKSPVQPVQCNAPADSMVAQQPEERDLEILPGQVQSSVSSDPSALIQRQKEIAHSASLKNAKKTLPNLTIDGRIPQREASQPKTIDTSSVKRAPVRDEGIVPIVLDGFPHSQKQQPFLVSGQASKERWKHQSF